jgi:regulator of sigma E protease
MLIVLAIVGLAVLIIVHEAGHFVVARLCGMRVERFSIGFGPAIVKFTRGETIYQIGAIPLGGFVQIAGLNGDDDARRTAIERDGRFEHVELPSDPRLYYNRPVWQRLLTIFAGPGTNYLFAAIMMSAIYVGFGRPEAGPVPMVYEIMDGTPAAQGGLELGDEVLAIDGKAVKGQNEVAPIIEASQGRAVHLEVRRGHDLQTLTITPQKIDGAWRVGIKIGPREVFKKVPVGTAIGSGLVFPYLQTREIFHGFAEIFRGNQKAEFSGPIGIVRQMKGQLARGTAEGLSVIAIISVYLGLFNLLPLPALDGGRLIFLVVEGFSRRRVNQRLEQTIHLVGMFALLGFMLYITVVKDLGLGKIFH